MCMHGPPTLHIHISITETVVVDASEHFYNVLSLHKHFRPNSESHRDIKKNQILVRVFRVVNLLAWKCRKIKMQIYKSVWDGWVMCGTAGTTRCDVT